jgi:hypothetical protein
MTALLARDQAVTTILAGLLARLDEVMGVSDV